MIRITATYNGPALPLAESFKPGTIYILFPTCCQGGFYIHDNDYNRHYYQSAVEFLDHWVNIALYAYKLSPEDKEETAHFLTNTLRLRDF